MLRTRVIPCLLLKGETLVKTVRFKRSNYIGDPVNTVRIFNELEVDELSVLDIDASVNATGPNFELLQSITNECFMPLSYGGGVSTMAHAERLFKMGFEKVMVNSAVYSKPELVTEIAEKFGSQAVIVGIDVKKKLFGGYALYSHSGRKKQPISPIDWAIKVQQLGAGEILLTSIDNEGTWSGFDTELVRLIASAVDIPVIANGGAKDIASIQAVVKNTSVSAVALGSMVVYQSKGMGVLVNFPDKIELEQALK